MAGKRYLINLGQFVIGEVARTRAGNKIPIPVNLLHNKKFLTKTKGILKKEIADDLKKVYAITYGSAASAALYAAMPVNKPDVKGELPVLSFSKSPSDVMKRSRSAQVYSFLGDVLLQVTASTKVRQYSWKYLKNLKRLEKKGKLPPVLGWHRKSKQFLSVTGGMEKGLSGVQVDMLPAVRIWYPANFKTVTKAGRLAPRYRAVGGQIQEILRMDGVTLGADHRKIVITGAGRYANNFKRLVLPGILEGRSTWGGESEPLPSKAHLNAGLKAGDQPLVAAARWIQAMRHRPMAARVAEKIGNKLRPHFLKYMQQRYGNQIGRKVRIRS